ncbi:MAG: hypothetical protein QXO25_00390 [Candidatus Bathyarchaeia archaeon]
MTTVMDPISILNLVLSVIILIFGYWGYRKKKDPIPLLVGVAFGLFGLTHLLTVLGFREILTNEFLVVRTLGYLIVVFALYKTWKT